MRLLILLTLFGCLQATASSYGQTVSLDLRNDPLEKALKEIKRQTGYSFIYTRVQLKHALPVTLQLKDATVEEALDYCFQNQPLSYTIEDKYVVVLDKPDRKETKPDQTIDVSGKVVDENGNALLRITVTAVKSGKSTYTNEKGEFSLKAVLENDILEFTSVGYGKVEVAIGKKAFHNITMKLVVGVLDETVIMAYGKTTRRLNTGNIGKVNSKEISQQPILDPLAALHGKVPGLVVTQSSGIPGSSVKIQIRGQNSLSQGSEPLIIVDGVPFAANNQPVSSLNSILTTGLNVGLSPIASINPLDIESIEILKDADATAIYGSRGANGVVLITTKKGKVGKTIVFVNFYKGWSKVSELPEMLTTKEYLRMRNEAFGNDGLSPTSDPFSSEYAPDLLIWDTTKEQNFSKMMLGGTSHSYDAQIGVSGGDQNLQFYVSSGYNKEGAIFPGNMESNRISLNNNLAYTSTDKRFSLQLNTAYSKSKNNLINASIASFLSLPPNTPDLYSQEGKLNWQEGGYGFDNPLAYLLKAYSAETENFLGNLLLSYRILNGLSLRSSIGYNSMYVSEQKSNPIVSQNPNFNPEGSLSVANNSFKNWIIEPQLEYEKRLGKGSLMILVGSTILQNQQKNQFIEASGYSSDNLINSLDAGNISAKSNNFSDYKYMALFGRINYNWQQKYMLNLTARKDGSSRFGPGRRFANFGAIGVGWLFDHEKFISNLIPAISYGKVRASYGLTGNDQIGNYKYLDTWSPYYNYQGISTLYPTGLYNPQYGWETNKKLEIAIEFGLFKDRLYLSAGYFNNRGKNQLVSYALPSQTGFVEIIRNFPALIENKGWELDFTITPIKKENFTWSSSLNITIPSNKLLSFPGLSSSSYSATYVQGQSLNLIYQLHSLGVDKNTGFFIFDDIDKDGNIQIPQDLQVNGNVDPKYYGGFRSTLVFKDVELGIFFDFKKQTGRNVLFSIYSNNYMPGFIGNQPTYILDRWQRKGDVTNIQKFTTINYSDAYLKKDLLKYSNGIYSDASFIRMKTISISWKLPSIISKNIKSFNSKLFVAAQNLFVISKYKGTDPEIQNFYALPSLRTIATGINITF